MFSQRRADLSGLILDLGLHPYATYILSTTLETMTEAALGCLIEEVVLRSNPHRIHALPGPPGGPYSEPGARPLRVALAVRAVDVVSQAGSLSHSTRDLVLAASTLGSLAPCCTGTGRYPSADAVPSAIWARAIAARERLTESALDWRRLARVARLAPAATGHPPHTTSAVSAPYGVIRAAAWIVDHTVPHGTNSSSRILPHWADPDVVAGDAWEELAAILRRRHCESTAVQGCLPEMAASGQVTHRPCTILTGTERHEFTSPGTGVDRHSDPLNPPHPPTR